MHFFSSRKQAHLRVSFLIGSVLEL